MKNNTETLNISFSPVEQKEAAVQELLKPVLGLCLRAKNGILLAMKALAVNQISLDLSPGHSLFVFAISNSGSEARNFQNVFWTFRASFVNMFSKRDLSLTLVQDYVCRYLQTNFYNRESERPIPLEIFLLEFEKGKRISFGAVDYKGEVVLMSDFCVIGCHDPVQREAVEKCLKEVNLEEISVEEAGKLAQEITKPFEGNLMLYGLVMVEKSAPSTAAEAPPSDSPVDGSQPT